MDTWSCNKCGSTKFILVEDPNSHHLNLKFMQCSECTKIVGLEEFQFVGERMSLDPTEVRA